MDKQELFNKIFEDPESVKQVQQMSDPEEIRQYLAERGVSFSEEEFDSLLRGIGKAVSNKMEEGELSEDSLESVAGGSAEMHLVAGPLIMFSGMYIGVPGVAALAYCAYKYFKKKKK